MPLAIEVPLRLLRAFAQEATLPAYELDRAHVRKRRSRLRPFDPQRGFTGDPACPKVATPPHEVRLTGWRLAHAVRKADCLRSLPFDTIAQVGFILEHVPTIDWRRGNLRLFDGLARAYKDVTHSSLAGRFGQGIALLLTESLGYAFVAHYTRATSEPGPDFIVESRAQRHSRALIEAKGAFVLPQEQPNIKQALKDGLHQVEQASPHGAGKSYVVASFLRENGDRHIEPSLIAFVDPPRTRRQLGLDGDPEDWIVRHNYAAWLDAMGLHHAASDLRSRAQRDSSERVLLRIVHLRGVAYGVVIVQALLPDDWDELFMHPWPWRNGRVVVAGLPTSILRRISDSLRHPARAFTVPEDVTHGAVSGDVDDTFKGSVLTDGSMLGALPMRELLTARHEEVAL